MTTTTPSADRLDDTLGHAMHELNTAVESVELALVPDGATVDLIGDLAAIVRRINALKKGHEAEAPPDEPGTRWVYKSGRKSDRTFNWMRIIADYMTATDQAAISAVLDLVDRGALRFTGLWSKLEPLLTAAGVDIDISSSELPDGVGLDDPHVGTVWKTVYKIEAVETPSGVVGF